MSKEKDYRFPGYRDVTGQQFFKITLPDGTERAVTEKEYLTKELWDALDQACLYIGVGELPDDETFNKWQAVLAKFPDWEWHA